MHSLAHRGIGRHGIRLALHDVGKRRSGKADGNGGLGSATVLTGRALACHGSSRRRSHLARRSATLGAVARRSPRHTSANDGRRLNPAPMGGKRVHERHRKADKGDTGGHLDGGGEALGACQARIGAAGDGTTLHT